MRVYLAGTGSVPYNTQVSFHHNESLLFARKRGYAIVGYISVYLAETGMRALKYIQGSFHP